ncbi:MAG TPA: fibronectin type III domain-containing protein [Gammaproteobacteria bacterium]|nr:fibronectin type III domain-containing protein [Gammaproteobacteria bacterium]
MLKLKGHQGLGCDFARKGRLLAAAALMSIVLTACGGGGGDGGSPSPAAAAPTPTSAGENAPLAATASAKGTTTLSWTPPTMNEDGTPLKLTGYRIYWGLQADNLTESVTLNNPGLTRYVIEQLKPATWYFVATALSSDGESEPSNVIAMQVR